MLLAAGRGSRLRPLTDDRPKCLLEVGGAPLIVRAVDLVSRRGLCDFTVVDGYLGDRVRETLTARFPPGWFRFVRNEEWDATGNAYSLLHALRDREDPFMLLDADVAFVPGVIDLLVDDARPNRLALRSRGEMGEEEMKVRLDADGGVAALGKEIPVAEAAGESIGIEVFSAPCARLLRGILEQRVREGPGREEFYEVSFEEAIRAGEAIHPVDIGDLACLEIDTVEDLGRARARFGAGS